MKVQNFAFAVASALLIASPAFAAYNCTGNYFGFDFQVSGATAGNVATGPVSVVVSQDGSVVRTTSMTPSASAIVAGKSFALNAVGEENSTLTMSTTFQGGAYKGPLDIGNAQGHAQPAMTCTLN